MFTVFPFFFIVTLGTAVVTSASLNCGSYASSDYYKHLWYELSVWLSEHLSSCLDYVSGCLDYFSWCLVSVVSETYVSEISPPFKSSNQQIQTKHNKTTNHLPDPK